MANQSLGVRILSAFLALVLVFSACPIQAFAAETNTDAREDQSVRLPFTEVEDVDADVLHDATKVKQPEEEDPYAPTDVVRVSIVLNKKATLEVYAAADVASNAAAMAYRDQLQAEQSAVIARIERDVLDGENLDVVWSMTLAANIISANVMYGQMDDIEAIRGVKEVFVENQYEALESTSEKADPMMFTSSSMIGSANAWAAGYTGAGTRIAIIDTGLDTNHQSFNNGAFLYSLQQNAEAKGMPYEEYIESLDLLTAADVAAVLEDLNVYEFVEHLTGTARGAYYLNEKIPFAINYVDSNYDVTHDNDNMGDHGSHVAGIAIANRFIPAGNSYVNALTEVSMQGVAPDAQVIVMKVFGSKGGAYESDYMVAIEDAIILGCDAVNLSLGTDKGFVRNRQYQDILDILADNDVIVAVAAGNSGAWADYAAHGSGLLYVEDVDYGMVATPSTATNAMSVASADNVGFTSYYIGLGEEMLFYTESVFSDGSALPPFTTVAGDVNYVLIDGIGTVEEIAAVVDAMGGAVPANTVFICARGELNFGTKAANAVDAGFIATIVYNNTDGALIMNMDGYEYTAPAVSVSQVAGNQLREAASAVTGVDGSVVGYRGTMYISDKVHSGIVTEDFVMSSFSSWGVPSNLTMKPEITAPGGDIYSVNGLDPSGTAYMNNSGTSMASPQIAGMAALVMQYIEETGLDVKLGVSSRKLASSLLMSTAVPMKNGANYYSVMQQGAGLANVGNAVASQSYLWMAPYANAGAADGKIKVELGDDPDRNGNYSFTFTLNNFGTEPQIYSISGDFFTQNVVTIDGITYADKATTALNMGVGFAIESGFIATSEKYSCDLNGDGITDEKDALIILDYVSGKINSIDACADVSSSNGVTSYDAHLLLASIGEGYFMVPAGDSITISVTMNMSDVTKAHLDATYPNGAYVEGFVTVQPLITEEGAVQPAHSIPVLGFYGNWSDATMYDRLSYEEYVYGMENGTDFVFPYAGYTNYLTFFDEDDYEHSFVGNPYIIEDTFPADKLAIRPTMEFGDMATSLIRNAGGFLFYVEDAEGNVVNAVSADQLKAAYYYINGGFWNYANTAGLSIWETPEQLGGFQEGETFTIGFFSVPEYYELDGALTLEQMLALKESGKIGPGAYYTYTFTVDGTDPELLDVVKLEDGDLKIKVKDNRHVAAVSVLTSTGGNVLYSTAVDQDQLDTVTELVLDMDGVRVNRKCLIMVADYAGNEVYYELEYNDGLADFEGRMYAFTNAKSRGALNTWMEITVEDLYYNGGDASLEIDPTMGGTQDMASMDASVLAAEYVGGYVYMATSEGELRVALQGEWDSSYLAAVNEDYKFIKDMAFNTQDQQMYALGADNTVYTIDLYTGVMTKQYTVSIVAPTGASEEGLTKQFNDENKKLLTLAIDDEGNFYAVNNGNSTYQLVYLYSWTAEDVQNGTITNLQPVNNTYNGYAGEYAYNDDIPSTGEATTQSMAWDHDGKVLYWASALNAVSGYNYLYTFNTETGRATVATGPIEGTPDYAWGCLCVNVSGLYIVPQEDAIHLDSADKATDLRISKSEVSLLVGSQFQLEWDVLPWNLTNKAMTWESSNTDVVEVTSTGRLKAVGVGKATIIMTSVTNPNLHKYCEVTVEEIQDVTMNGMLYNSDDKINWVSFNLLNADEWTQNFVESEYDGFIAGGMHDDMIYLHDGLTMYGVDANTFEVTKYTDIHETWLWSDAAQGPETPKGYFDRLVGIINGGLCIGVMDIELASGYEVPHYADFGKDLAALIAYVGPTTYFDGFEVCDAHEYYIMTESGDVYHDIIYAFFDKDMQEVVYSDHLTYVGSTGLNLKGMANVKSDNRGSLYYDEDTGYLIVTMYRYGNESASISVFEPDACAPVTVGSFGTDIWPVVSLYAYDALTDLTVKVKPNKADIYVGETVKLSASVYMFNSNNRVTWSSSDASIATVDANGIVTALKEGTVTITATTQEKRDDGTRATSSATITVKPLAELDVMLHAYVQTKDGGKWVAIDGKGLNQYKLADSDAKYTGAGAIGGKIFASDETTYYMIDPNGNGYTAVKGDNFTDGKGASFLYVLDSTASPAVTRDFTDLATGETVKDVIIGGNPVYISGTDETGANYLVLLQDFTTGEYIGAALDAGRASAAIAYHESEESAGYWFERYYVLGVDGMLEHYEVGYYVENGELLTLGGWAVDYIPTGLEFADNDDLSMVYVETGDFKGLVISYATNSGTELWCYDTVQLKLRKMGVLDSVIDLVGLSVLTDDLGVSLPENPDDPQEPGTTTSDYVYGYVKTGTGYAWVKINTETMAYQVIAADNTGFGAGAALDGKVYAVTSASQYGNTTYTFQQLDPAKRYAMNSVSGATAHTNGYSPADMAGVPSVDVTLVDSTDGQTYTKTMGGYMVDAANGKYSSSKPMLFLMTNYRSFTTTDAEIYFPEKTFADKFAAIVYTGSEISEDNKQYHDYFLILDQSGNLYEMRLASCLQNGTVVLESGRTVSKVAALDLKAKTGASISRVTENKAYISVNTSAGTVELYSIDLTTYAVESLGILSGVMTLSALHSDAELTGDFTTDVPVEPDEPEVPECDHTNVGDWESDETGHWKTCQCGEKVEQGEHSFVEGKCICGYADPNYVPEQPEEPAGDSSWLHAYVKTADGYAWVMMDPATGEYEVIAEGTANYTGGGFADGKIYTSVNEYGQPTLYVVDPLNGYSAAAGFMDDINFAKMMDASSGPAKTVVINGTEVQVGRPVYVGCDTTMPDYQYIGVIINPDVRRDNKFASNEFYDGSIMRGIAYVSGEMAADGASYVETFVILFNNGKLYTCTVTYKGNTKADISVSLGDCVETGLNASKGASMTLAEENVLCIALTTTSGVELYSYDLGSNTATELFDITDAQSLVALSLLSEVRPDLVTKPEQPEQPEETAATYHAYVKTESGYAWVEIDPATGANEVIAEGTANYTGGGYADGKIYTTVNEYGQPTLYVVDPANGYSATAGFMDDINFAKMMDAASGPAKTVVINGTEVQVGRPVYVGCDTTMPDYQFIGVIIDPNTRSKNKFASNEFYDGSIMRGIAYVSGEMAADGASYVETFVILFNNGKLYTCTVTYKGNTKADISVSLGDCVETGLNASKGASMTLAGENELCIALTTASGVELYSYDLTANTAVKLCTVAGVKSLVALSLMRDLEAADAKVSAVKRPTGSLMTAVSRNEVTETPDGENVTVADGNVTITVHKDGTNGKLVVTFDPTAMTYEGMSSASVFYSVNEAEAADGKLVIAYAAAQPVSVENILATLNFSYKTDYVDTLVTVITKEDNEQADLDTREEIIVSNAPAEDEYFVKWISATTSLNGTIDLNIYAALSENLVNADDTFVRFFYAGKVVDVPVKDAMVSEREEGIRYRFSLPMYIKYVSETVVFQFMKGDEVIGDTREYSIMQYCMNRIKDSQDPEEVAVCKSLLNYAAAAQLYLNYNTENLANAKLPEADKVLPENIDLSAYKLSVSGSEEGIRARSATLMMEEVVRVRVYFDVAEGYDINDYSFTINGQSAEIQRNSRGYFLETDGIAAKNLDTMFTFQVGDISVSYGAMTYVYNMLNRNDPLTVNLVKAIYGYHVAAKNYFG